MICCVILKHLNILQKYLVSFRSIITFSQCYIYAPPPPVMFVVKEVDNWIFR